MKEEYSNYQTGEFFTGYYRSNVYTTMLLSLITFGFYFAFWMYVINKRFQKIEDNAPETQIALSVLFVFPILWIPISLFLFELFDISTYITIVKALVWIIFSFTILRFLYDFCEMFAKLTKTEALIWYLMLFSGYGSFVLMFFGFYYTFPFIFLALVTMIVMQEKLNKRHDIFLRKKHNRDFESMKRVY